MCVLFYFPLLPAPLCAHLFLFDYILLILLICTFLSLATSIFVPFVVGASLSIYLWNLEPHTANADFTSYYLFMGTSFSFTALPVLARILAGHGLVTHEIGVQVGDDRRALSLASPHCVSLVSRRSSNG